MAQLQTFVLLKQNLDLFHRPDGTRAQAILALERVQLLVPWVLQPEAHAMLQSPNQQALVKAVPAAAMSPGELARKPSKRAGKRKSSIQGPSPVEASLPVPLSDENTSQGKKWRKRWRRAHDALRQLDADVLLCVPAVTEALPAMQERVQEALAKVSEAALAATRQAGVEDHAVFLEETEAGPSVTAQIGL